MLPFFAVSEASGYSSGYESEPPSSESPRVEEPTETESYGPQRRVRSKFSPEQVSQLEKIFTKHKYLETSERVKTAQKLNLTETQVRQDSEWKPASLRNQMDFSYLSCCTILTYFSSFSLTGEDLVSEQENEDETGGPRLHRTPNSSCHVPTLGTGSLPRHGRRATPLPREQPGLLPATCATDASSTPQSSGLQQPTFLLKESERLFPLQTRSSLKVQSWSYLKLKCWYICCEICKYLIKSLFMAE